MDTLELDVDTRRFILSFIEQGGGVVVPMGLPVGLCRCELGVKDALLCAPEDLTAIHAAFPELEDVTVPYPMANAA